MKKLLLLIILSSPIFAQNTQNTIEAIYPKLDGLWRSPHSGELDIFFTITNGNFTVSIVPLFEYTNLSTQQQKTIIKENIPDSSGYFEILSILKSHNNSDKVCTIILLNDELSTNIIDITTDKIYIYDNISNTKTVFAEKVH